MHERTNWLANLRLVPNQITAVRFLMVPLTWGLALAGLPGYIGPSLAVCLVSDALDGHMARRLNQVTEFGGRFDSLADNILIPSALVWLLMFKPAVFADHTALSLLAIGTYASSLTVGWIRFRRFGNLHLYLSKVSGVVQYVFIIHTFMAPGYNTWLFHLAISLFFLSSLETLLLQLTRSEANAQMKSIFFTRRRLARE
jgi:cardiolipin synthase